MMIKNPKYFNDEAVHKLFPICCQKTPFAWLLIGLFSVIKTQSLNLYAVDCKDRCLQSWHSSGPVKNSLTKKELFIISKQIRKQMCMSGGVF